MICARSVLILVLLTVACQSQRGGGSSRSSSSSRRSSWGSRRSSWGSWSTPTSNSATANAEGQSAGTWKWVVGGLGVVGVFGYIGLQQEKKRQKARLQKIQRELSEFEGSMESMPCDLSPQEMSSAKDWFMKQNWKIQLRTNDNMFTDTATVTIRQLKPKSQFSYTFSMSMNDSIGSSSARGVLVHTGKFFSIQFEKTYSDRTKAGQTGNFDLLLYRGSQNQNIFMGGWAYKGYEGHGQYAGQWRMIPS